MGGGAIRKSYPIIHVKTSDLEVELFYFQLEVELFCFKLLSIVH